MVGIFDVVLSFVCKRLRNIGADSSTSKATIFLPMPFEATLSINNVLLVLSPPLTYQSVQISINHMVIYGIMICDHDSKFSGG